MKVLPIAGVMMAWLLAQGCTFSNVPFLPLYNVEVDVTDPNATSGNSHFSGTFNKGASEAVTTTSDCSVQIQLGQCKSAEQVWVVVKAVANNTGNRGPDCNPTVWQRLKDASGKSLAVGPSKEATLTNGGVYVEVLVGLMEDTDGNKVVDRHSNENRIATDPLVTGRIDIYRATDNEAKTVDGFKQPGEFLADIDVGTPGVGSVKGRIDASVDAADGWPVGPRCGWDVLAEDN